jgi:chromosome partitioning protein
MSGQRVLLIDLDPQGNASTGLGLDRHKRGAGTYAVLVEGRAPHDLIQSTAIQGLQIIPSDPDLAGAEVELVGFDRREFRLRNAIAGLKDFDFIIIDCPPSLSLLTLNGLVAASSVLVPLQCEFFALEGISQLVRTIELVKRGLNPALTLQGIVLTMFDRRNNLSDLVAADARSFFGDRVYQTVIPRNIRITEAPSHGQPVLIYDRNSAGAVAYTKLAEEMLLRQRQAAA